MGELIKVLLKRLQYPIAVFLGVCAAVLSLSAFLYFNPGDRFTIFGQDFVYTTERSDRPFWALTAGFGIYEQDDDCSQRALQISQEIEEGEQYSFEDVPPSYLLVDSDRGRVLVLRCFPVNGSYFLHATLATSREASAEREFSQIYNRYSDF